MVNRLGNSGYSMDKQQKESQWTPLTVPYLGKNLGRYRESLNYFHIHSCYKSNAFHWIQYTVATPQLGISTLSSPGICLCSTAGLPQAFNVSRAKDLQFSHPSRLLHQLHLSLLQVSSLTWSSSQGAPLTMVCSSCFTFQGPTTERLNFFRFTC